MEMSNYFVIFLESLKTNENSILIESLMQAHDELFKTNLSGSTLGLAKDLLKGNAQFMEILELTNDDDISESQYQHLIKIIKEKAENILQTDDERILRPVLQQMLRIP